MYYAYQQRKDTRVQWLGGCQSDLQKYLNDAIHKSVFGWPLISHWGATIGVSKSRVMDVILLTSLPWPSGQATTLHGIELANIYTSKWGDGNQQKSFHTFDQWFLIHGSSDLSTSCHNQFHHIVHKLLDLQHDTQPPFQTVPEYQLSCLCLWMSMDCQAEGIENITTLDFVEHFHNNWSNWLLKLGKNCKKGYFNTWLCWSCYAKEYKVTNEQTLTDIS